MSRGQKQPDPAFHLIKGKRQKHTRLDRRIGKIRQSVAFWETGNILIWGIVLIIIGPVYAGSVLILFPGTEFQLIPTLVIAVICPLLVLAATLLACLWSKYEWRRLSQYWQEKEKRKKKFQVVRK